jgi:hypothetical protein
MSAFILSEIHFTQYRKKNDTLKNVIVKFRQSRYICTLKKDVGMVHPDSFREVKDQIIWRDSSDG